MARSKSLYIQAAVAAVIVIASAVAAFSVLPIHQVKTGRLAKLVPAAPPPGFNAKPASASVQNSSQSSFPAVKAAAKRAPNQTGTYTIDWSSKTSGDSASVLLSLLPTKAEGQTALGQVRSQALSATAYTSDSYKFSSSLSLPGVPGSSGAFYVPTTSSVKQLLAVSVVPFRNAVAVVFVDQTGAAATVEQHGIALAQAEYQQLEREVPGFSLESTRWPTIATIVWIAVTALLVLGVLTVPGIVRRTRARRELARQEAARRLVLARGSKIARRQATHKR